MSRLALTIVFLLFSTYSFAKDRSTLHLFQYAHAGTSELEGIFVYFHDLLIEKMPMLSEEVSEAESNIEALLSLNIKPKLDNDGNLLKPSQLSPPLSSGSDKYNHWKRSGALALLTGRVSKEQGVPYVKTTFYWGDLDISSIDNTSSIDKFITIKLPVTGETFDSTNDSHSVATLFALAHVIKRNCDNISQTMYLLSEASKRAKAVIEDTPETGLKLSGLIDNSISNLKASCSEQE